MATRPLPALLLSGFMGTGKSTVARIVAARMNAPLVDLDEAIERDAGAAIATVFREQGEPAFRALEAAALARALAEPGPRVIALGGGALLDAGTRRRVLERACVVTLLASVDTLVARTEGRGRPLLEGASDRATRIAALLHERAAAYAEAHATLATDGWPPESVADAVIAAWTTRAIAVPLGLRSYAVRIAPRGAAPSLLADAIAAGAPSAAFVITDENVRAIAEEGVVAALSARGVRVGASIALPPGEPNKQLAAVEAALRAMVGAGADRDAVVLALGGGVVSDIAGFAAATLLRGVRWVVAPTTLLAMVDASVGGKTGVDVGSAKNAAGAFHQPSAVVVAPEHVATESPRGYVSGLAEVVKAGAIGDPALIDLLEAEAVRVLARDLDLVEELVARAIAVKAAIVARDERESGERAHLNFGHTVGHALEAEGGFARLTHGEAVSLGMVAMLRAGRALGLTDPAAAERLVRLLDRLGLPVDLDAQPLARALPLVAHDKKRRGGAVRVVLLRELGAPFLRPMDLAALTAALTG